MREKVVDYGGGTSVESDNGLTGEWQRSRVPCLVCFVTRGVDLNNARTRVFYLSRSVLDAVVAVVYQDGARVRRQCHLSPRIDRVVAQR